MRAGQGKVLTKDEMKRLHSVIRDNKHSLRNTCIFDFSFFTGLRVGEISSLKLKDILTPSRELVKSFTLKGKGGKYRTVYLSNKTQRRHLQAYLSTRVDDNAELPLIKSQRTHFTPNTLQQCMKRIYVKAGIDGAKSHSGRRTFATRLIQKGADIRCLQVLMGHSNISITARYIQENPVRLSEMVKDL